MDSLLIQLKNIRQFHKEGPIRFVASIKEKYGDIAFTPVLGQPIYHLFNPDDVGHVLGKNSANYIKGMAYRPLRLFFGNGLVTNDGPPWKQQRKLIQPAFNPKAIPAYFDIMSAHIQNFLTQMAAHDGTCINLADHIKDTTLSVIWETIFGILPNDTHYEKESLDSVMRYIFNAELPLFRLPLAIPTPTNVKMRYHLNKINRYIYSAIHTHKTVPHSNFDMSLLSFLLAAKDAETDAQMSDQQIRDEVITLFGAGHETIYNALTWIFYILDKHPDVLEKVEREIMGQIGDRTPLVSDIQALPYTEMVVKEVLRLYPPIGALGRESIGEDQLSGHSISKKSQVFLYNYFIHRDPRYWENPDVFDPERFSKERSKDRHPYAYLPFGSGPRFCIGNHFAMMEMLTMLAWVVPRFQFKLKPGHTVVEASNLGLMGPVGGLPVIIKKKENRHV